LTNEKLPTVYCTKAKNTMRREIRTRHEACRRRSCRWQNLMMHGLIQLTWEMNIHQRLL
jgi:hypothetical protein